MLFFGTSLPEDRWHDSDESVAVDVLLAGAATLALFWSRLAGTHPTPSQDLGAGSAEPPLTHSPHPRHRYRANRSGRWV
ncbi:hypothetical protein LADH09A_003862 [Micromonospora sp. LAH09]|uniref:hypothetical protein n=1 Tax=Micromonospora cabrerizensis TaxID=2911213 RepID=UPI001EE942E0|nr:hypothetical protein [Micromonospora cabrerizensis]MCG5469923.1 hypothetical protein [Micromonospora cabrerizensis]